MSMKPRKIWDNVQKLGEVQKAPNTKLVVELAAREGVKYINVREWYRKKTDLVWKPGASGMSFAIAVPVENDTLTPAATLAALIANGLELAPSFALDDPEKAVYYYPQVGD